MHCNGFLKFFVWLWYPQNSVKRILNGKELYSYIWLLWYVFTPWSRVLLLEILTVNSYLRNPDHFWNLRINCHVPKFLPLDHILNKMNSVHTLPPYFFTVNCNVILISLPRSSNKPIFFMFLGQSSRDISTSMYSSCASGNLHTTVQRKNGYLKILRLWDWKINIWIDIKIVFLDLILRIRDLLMHNTNDILHYTQYQYNKFQNKEYN